VLVSEVMLQQTPVARVLPVWHEWLQRWPTPIDLAAEPPGEVVRAWGRLGYPRRALRLHQAASAIRDEHAGEVPSTHAELLALPGVGDYTAAAVASFAFGSRHAVVDTNVRRVFARAVSGLPQAAPAVTRAELKLAGGLVPLDAATAATWAVAVMELGALVCTARRPVCAACPLAGQCAWRLAGSPPPDEASKAGRRSQPWQGTDRQVRGRLLAVVREANGPVPGVELRAAVTRAGAVADEQLARSLASLQADGLLDRNDQGDYHLPH
jgi:A/G-specific adenine glycosylase